MTRCSCGVEHWSLWCPVCELAARVDTGGRLERRLDDFEDALADLRADVELARSDLDRLERGLDEAKSAAITAEDKTERLVDALRGLSV